MIEHDWEPVRGLPGALPAGEHILWQGAPTWRVLAGRSFHLRSWAVYFAALLCWYGAVHGVAGAAGLARFAGLAALALVLLAAFAALVARTTVYTVTNRRIAIRYGIAFSATLNLPLAVVEAADARSHADGSGDVALRLAPGSKVAYLLLWPHARPWRLSRPEPMLRAVPNVAALSAALCRAALPAPSFRPAVPAAAAQPAFAA